MRHLFFTLILLLAASAVGCSQPGDEASVTDAPTATTDASATSTAIPPTASSVGEPVGAIRSVQRSGAEPSIGRGSEQRPAGRNDELYELDVLTTGPGFAQFEIRAVTTCNSYENSEVTVRPDAEKELDFGRNGTSDCWIDGASRLFGLNGEPHLLRNQGTIFRVTAVEGIFRIAVVEGFMDVIDGGSTRTIGPRQELNLSTGELLRWIPQAHLEGLLELQGFARDRGDPRTVSPVDLVEGECFTAAEDLREEFQVELVVVVDCEGDYEAQLLAWVPVEDAEEYPGAAFLLDLGRELCAELDATSYLIPSEEHWSELDARDVACLDVPGLIG